MNRIHSLSYSFHLARDDLRLRFAALPAEPPSGGRPLGAGGGKIDDTDLLRLLKDTTAKRNDPEAQACQEYERLRSEQEGDEEDVPEYTSLFMRGWFRTMHGCVVPSRGLRDHFMQRSQPFPRVLQAFVLYLSDVQYQIAQPTSYASASPFEEYIKNGALGERPAVQSPTWIAARLWDGSQPDLASWVTRWDILGQPLLSPYATMAPEDAQCFEQAAIRALASANFRTWQEPGMDAMEYGPLPEPDSCTGELRLSLLGLHLSRPSQHRGTDMELSLQALFRVLAADLPQATQGPVPSAVAEEVVALALRYPDLCRALIDCCIAEPKVMADLILCPSAAGLVCYLVASWHRRGGADKEARVAVLNAVQGPLLAACLDVYRYHLLQRDVSAEEFSRLLVALHKEDSSALWAIGLQHVRELPQDVAFEIRQSLVRIADGKANSIEFVVLLKVAAAIGRPLPEAEAKVLAATYQKAYGGDDRPDMRQIDPACAAVLGQVAMGDPILERQVCYPLNLEGSSAQSTTRAVYMGLALREHIRVMSRAVAGYTHPVPYGLVKALASAIESGSSDRPDRDRYDAFTFDLDANLSRHTVSRLEADVLSAILRVTVPADQELLLEALLMVEDPLLPAWLLPRVPKVQQERIASRLLLLSPKVASRAALVPQAVGRVREFIDARLLDQAKRYLEEAKKLVSWKRLPHFMVELYALELRIHFERGEFDPIYAATVPDGLTPEIHDAVQQRIDFYLALLLLKQGKDEAKQAARIFRRLHGKDRLVMYAAQLLSARKKALLCENEFQFLAGDEADDARRAIKEADAAGLFGGAPYDLDRALCVPSHAALLLALGRPEDALTLLYCLTASQRTSDSMAYEAVASARIQDPQRAKSLIHIGKELFGNVALLREAEEHIDLNSGFGAPPFVLANEALIVHLRAALTTLRSMSPSARAEVLVDSSPRALERLLARAMQDALAGFQQLLSHLRLHRTKYHEDNYNAIVAALLNARLDGILGFQAHEQSPGGYTRIGNHGERDITIRWNGVDVAVFEALKAKSARDKQLTLHFHKLIAYSPAELLFHVTYSEAAHPSKMQEAVKAVAEQPPDSMSFRGLDASAYPGDGSRPDGQRATYLRANKRVTVVFFVIDVVQATQRGAVGAPSAL